MPESPFLDVLDNDDDGENEDKQESDNSSFRDLRAHAKRLERQVAKLQKEREALLEFKTKVEEEKKQATVARLFKEVGLSEKHAGLFIKVTPDLDPESVSVETVRSFAEEYDLPLKQEPSSESPETGVGQDWSQEKIREVSPKVGEKKEATGFAPVAPGALTSARIITDVSEAAKLYVSNPEEYVRLRQAGRIQLPKLPGNS